MPEAKQRWAAAAVEEKPPSIPTPVKGERPTVFADRVGVWYVAQRTVEQRRQTGLYLTPVSGADLMAGRLQVSGGELRLLDPAAGAGILSCAAVEALVTGPNKPSKVFVVGYEVDAQLLPALGAVFEYLTSWCDTKHKVSVIATIEPSDFLLAHAAALRPASELAEYAGEAQAFDIVIANPPYFKITKRDRRAAAVSSVVHGQPNIYGLFMAVGAALLRQHGDFVYIVPRSFVSGPYFRRLRTSFFTMMQPTSVHVFRSRREPFRRDGVLQENIVFCGVRRDNWNLHEPDAVLRLSSSRGVTDIADAEWHAVPTESVLNMRSSERALRLPLSCAETATLALVDSWPCNLRSLGLNISTGRVVPFRATSLISDVGTVPTSHAPLLWMNHVRPMQRRWPLNQHKPEFIRRQGADSLLVPNKNYVLLRRFSGKTGPRRLTSAPHIAIELDAPGLGIENHLNYIYRPNGHLSEDEAWGLAALYNSGLLNTFFRAVGGTTQVNATDLRLMPLPTRDKIVDLGRQVRNLNDPLDGLDSRVVELVVTPGPHRCVLPEE